MFEYLLFGVNYVERGTTTGYTWHPPAMFFIISFSMFFFRKLGLANEGEAIFPNSPYYFTIDLSIT